MRRPVRVIIRKKQLYPEPVIAGAELSLEAVAAGDGFESVVDGETKTGFVDVDMIAVRKVVERPDCEVVEKS
jgi:hypothetical protein